MSSSFEQWHVTRSQSENVFEFQGTTKSHILQAHTINKPKKSLQRRYLTMCFRFLMVYPCSTNEEPLGMPNLLSNIAANLFELCNVRNIIRNNERQIGTKQINLYTITGQN